MSRDKVIYLISKIIGNALINDIVYEKQIIQ